MHSEVMFGNGSTTGLESDNDEKVFHVDEKVELKGFFTPHDRYQVEFKMDFGLDKGDTDNRYLVETYLFVPKTLGLQQHLKNPEEFFQNIKSYMKYTTPNLSLTELGDYNNPLSPMSRINNHLLKHKPIDQVIKSERPFDYEIRLFACIFKDSAKAELNRIKIPIKDQLPDQNHLGIFLKNINEYFETICSIRDKFIQLQNEVIKSIHLSQTDKEDFKYVQEFFYYELNFVVINLIKKIYQIKNANKSSKELFLKIEELFFKLQEVGKISDYPVLSSDMKPIEAEHYVHRESRLKKYVSSILFLNFSAKDRRKTEEIFYAIAAAVAMLFAVIATFISMQYYSINSMPFFIFAVLAYIVKDRMKAWMQDRFKNILPVYLAHRTEILVDEAFDISIGQLKEWMSFLNWNNLPEDVKDVRMYKRENNQAFPKNEEILYYKKDLLVSSKKILKNHMRVTKLTNILRFNVSNFCFNMDDPIKSLFSLDKEGNIQQINGRKSYHLNLIVKVTSRYKTSNAVSEKLNLRIIMSRDGIERIETPYGLDQEELFDVSWQD